MPLHPSDRPSRGPFLTACAVLFGLLALSNLLKPLQLGGERTGFVLFGIRLAGAANQIVAPLFGVFLGMYAYGIWRMRRFALPMGHFYAIYVVLNIFMFSYLAPTPSGAAQWLFGLGYATVAVGVSASAAVALTRRANVLR
jgi:hypothetical protein